MHNDFEKMSCRICGYINLEPPWGEDGKTPDFNICPCCGVEAGYEDCTKEAINKYRKSWLEMGSKWNEKEEKPKNWNIEEQFKNIPIEFR